MNTQPLLDDPDSNDSVLTLPYFEHFGATGRAYALSRRLTILHGYALGVLHLPFSATLHTICLHQLTHLLAPLGWYGE